jgi:hypothetical protein
MFTYPFHKDTHDYPAHYHERSSNTDRVILTALL